VSTSALPAYLHRAADDLLRPPAGHLRHPFLVPGAIYSAEQWDWDAYWTTRGLLALGTLLDDDAFTRRVIAHGQGCIRNLFEHQAANGALPIMMKSDNPDMFGCLRPDGPEVNQAKPVVAQLALCVCDAANDDEWFAPFLPALDRFYARWESRYRNHTGLLVWGSDVAIGVDNDPTAYGRPGFSSANLLLNCLYIEDLRAASTLARRLGLHPLASTWTRRADELSTLVSSLCWDSRDRFFYTQDVQCGDHRAKLIPWAAPGMPMEWQSLHIRIQSFTGLLPLWCGAATPAQAEAMRDHALNPDTFHAAFGIRSLARNEPMFSLARSNNPSNWLGPIWIVANYFAWSGLRRYGFTAEATDLARRTLDLLDRDLQKTGALHEYYHPDTGAPLMNKGFLSWNYLTCEMLLVEPARSSEIRQGVAGLP
jgi:putative isomerase